jgi:hypothetical protein
MSTGKAGRPRSTHCKRGHERKPGEKVCIACRRFRERFRYESNPVLRLKKTTYQAQWRKDFFEKNGYWASAMYERPAA